MRAAICRDYGGPGVVRIEDRPVPVPGPGQVLIRVLATTVSAGDARIRAMRMPPGMGGLGRVLFGLRRPRQPVLGAEFCGMVETLGPGATGFAPGDLVVGMARGGVHADYAVLPANGPLIRKPGALSLHEAAAMAFGGTTALTFLRGVTRLRAGERLLVIGGAGAVGTAAVQIGRALGAGVAALTRPGNTALLAGLGAEPLPFHPAALMHEARRWDVVLDTMDLPRPTARALLEPDGRLLMVAAGLGGMLAPVGNALRRQKLHVGMAGETRADLEALADLVARGHFRPVIDCVLPFERIAEAHAIADSGAKRGSVVLDLTI
ncbi:MAG: hypothetical protein BGP11_09955 [Rhodobacterales bacterium 65-51]|uniref:NAD(P)-dependent alcohol dehydrogenase n=1 Tax=uncultured Gemmobacter sp. TaxID=1095917 RepID=UPI0009629695|nr:NAD(P)-dependent alcohol dehydrogenase [uncultured Gemmobacter sp.]OJY31889.1 MAG: hypothetical protein BGP11_09955 [Rhodobacterales bacterium 65-51]